MKTPDTDGYGKLVLQYGAGTTFGELALIQHTARGERGGDSRLLLFAMDRRRSAILLQMCRRLRFEALLEQTLC